MKVKIMTPGTPNDPTANISWRRVRRGFTLIEMVIVVGIVLLVLGLVLPASIDLWNERKISDADNIIRGLLMTARAKALRTDASETGLFFFLDEQGVQRIASIERNPENAGDPTWQDVFQVTDERTFGLPSPIRVVPRYVVDSDDAFEPYELFSAEELANNSFDFPTGGASPNQAQRHRNFFTMIYSSDGQLLNRRDVIIRDDDLTVGVTGAAARAGSVTGMQVGRGGEQEANVEEYYRQDDSLAPLDPRKNGDGKVQFAIIEPQSGVATGGVAMNFPSVDGLLVYDDSEFNSADDDPEARRRFLIRKARPFYVNRYTGAIIPGPYERGTLEE